MKGRLLQLDILRAIAILMVLGAHTPFQAAAQYKTPIFLPDSFMTIWARCGWAGVDLFFVLSGFLISGLLFREQKKYGNVEIVRFLIRRGFKIYPAFYVFLTTTLIVQTILWKVRGWEAPNGLGFLCEALFVQNYGAHIWGHTWSLAVEEHFYLLLGAGIFVLTLVYMNKKTNPFRFIPWIFLIIAPAIILTRIVNVHMHPPSLYPAGGWRENGVYTHLRFDSLLFGVVLSYFANFHTDATAALVRRFRWIILIPSCILAFTCVVFSPWSVYMYTIGFSLLYLGFGGILLIFVHWEPKSIWVNRIFKPLGLIGYYSYSIYLWHYAVITWSHSLQQHFFGIGNTFPILYDVPMYLVGSIVAGISMAKIVEMPFLRLRDRLYPSRSGSIAVKTLEENQETTIAAASASK